MTDQNDDEFAIDPAIAEAMGFSGFGMQASGKNKRKFDHDAFVDPSVQQAATSTAASSNVASLSKAGGTGGQGAAGLPSRSIESAGIRKSRAQGTSADGAGTRASQGSGQGGKNERGDPVYFLPSFIEDPWKGLVPR
ncbi:hypothetical protein B0A50_07159 [Salinomyces thailandicus]|uniref:Uncharacterized protein n=1 Tax=Salinomyces thailandicus TaxID=706561 RepID=A0A4V5N3D1_9PEZI|nr:hypothetical protein B0A50_07159 [Salinomyces thailandica]